MFASAFGARFKSSSASGAKMISCRMSGQMIAISWRTAQLPLRESHSLPVNRKFFTCRSAAQLFVAADRVPFAGAALPRLVLRGVGCQFGRHRKAHGRLNKRTLAGLNV